MPTGNDYRDALIAEIRSWGIAGLSVYKEVKVGSRFVGSARKLDIVIKYGDKTLGVEAKYQQTSGTADEKLVYAVEDAKITPIKTLVVLGGQAAKEGMQAFLISSGVGLIVNWSDTDGFDAEGVKSFKQRVYIELGLDWLQDHRPVE